MTAQESINIPPFQDRIHKDFLPGTKGIIAEIFFQYFVFVHILFLYFVFLSFESIG